MITYLNGDILDDDAEALVNTVNCVGFMGRGIALQFKRAYPENFKAYASACGRHEVEPGRMFVFETGKLTNPRYIINFPTKRHWRGRSRLEDIERGLEALAELIKERKITSIALPPLGSGLGGLDWQEVRPRIEEALWSLADVVVRVYEPLNADESVRMRVRSGAPPPRMTRGRAALVGLMERYLRGLMDPFVTLIEVHKLLYFMQEADEPLKLRFVKGHYGPYAENLRHVLQETEGHFITGYGDGGDAPNKQLELVPGAVEDARKFLESDTHLRRNFDKVAELVDGFESPFGLELLATVHWVVTHEQGQGATREDVIARVYDWNDRKRQFSPDQIGLALDHLKTLGWIS